jgi:hypothetical protein
MLTPSCASIIKVWSGPVISVAGKPGAAQYCFWINIYTNIYSYAIVRAN